MKVKSVSELAFKALDLITDDIGKLEVAHIIFDGQATRTGHIQKLMKADCGVPHYAVQLILRDLVAENLIQRTSQGVYAPNLKMLLPKMIEILDEEGKVNECKEII